MLGELGTLGCRMYLLCKFNALFYVNACLCCSIQTECLIKVSMYTNTCMSQLKQYTLDAVYTAEYKN